MNKNIMDRRSAILKPTAATIAATIGTTATTSWPSLSLAEEEKTILTTTTTPSIRLNTSIETKTPKKPFPLASFGLQVYNDDTAYKLTLIALQCGYRNFFASVLAQNQRGFAKAIKDSGINRDELYICGTVLSNRAVGYDKAKQKTYKGCQENMNAMNVGGIDYLDMIMLDYPGPNEESIRGQWNAFEQFQQDGFVTDLAVSNFSPIQLDYIFNDVDSNGVRPTVNQLPFSIANHPNGMLAGNTKRNIHVQSWSPLSSTLPKYKSQLQKIGQKYNKSAAQVGLRWIVQSGASFCTQSQNVKHFKEDLEVFDFELSESEISLLTSLEPPSAARLG